MAEWGAGVRWEMLREARNRLVGISVLSGHLKLPVPGLGSLGGVRVLKLPSARALFAAQFAPRDCLGGLAAAYEDKMVNDQRRPL